MSTRAVYKVAWLEFARVMANPIVLLAGLIIMVFVYAGDVGIIGVLQYNSLTENVDTAVLQGLDNGWASTGMICTILLAFLAATTIPYEKWSGSVNVLLTKPLYRRDFVLGKFLGLSSFALLFITFTVLFKGLMVIVLFRGPESVSTFLWHAVVFILIFSLTCWVVIALNMLFGIVSRSVLFVTAAAVTYYFIDWIWHSDIFFGSLYSVLPQILYWKLGGGSSYPSILTDSLVPFGQWFTYAVPYLAALLIELAVLLLAGILLFSRDDTT